MGLLGIIELDSVFYSKTKVAKVKIEAVLVDLWNWSGFRFLCLTICSVLSHPPIIIDMIVTWAVDKRPKFEEQHQQCHVGLIRYLNTVSDHCRSITQVLFVHWNMNRKSTVWYKSKRWGSITVIKLNIRIPTWLFPVARCSIVSSNHALTLALAFPKLKKNGLTT